MITAKEYNRRFKEAGYSYVVRNLFGSWAVCDGLCRYDDDVMIEENSIHAGYVIKYFDTFEEADNLRNILNA